MTNKRVVLVANTSWFLYNYRLSFAQTLQRAGYDVVCCAPEDRFSSQLEDAGFRWNRLDLGRQTLSPWTEIPSIRLLVQLYRQERPDIVHHFTIKPVIYGSLAARWVKVPAVVNDITGRGYIFQAQGQRGRILTWFGEALYRQAFRHPLHAVVFENDVDHKDFQDRNLLATPHIHLIEGAGVDTDYFFPLPHAHLQKPHWLCYLLVCFGKKASASWWTQCAFSRRKPNCGWPSSGNRILEIRAQLT